MPRGGRRRSRGRGRKPANAPQQQSGSGQSSQNRRRRRRRRGQQSSALDRMVAEGKTTTVQTLPADGTVLDEVISDMRSEYGTPATPQEFRLLIKVPGAETEAIQTDPADPQEEPAEPSGPDEVSAAPSSDFVETARRPPRRRRRGRRRQGSHSSSSVGSPPPDEARGGQLPDEQSSNGREPMHDVEDLFPPD